MTEPDDPGRQQWRETTRASARARGPERRERFRTTSGIEIADLYTPADTARLDEDAALGRPGEYPFTRGVQATMYRGRFWTMRQYAGFSTAADTNARFRYLLAQGQTGLSVAFDLPTQMGYDSDAPEASGEVGRVGVPIASIADMETLLDGLPLERGHDLDDDQLDRGDPPRVLRGRRGPARHPARPARRHGPERHPQGVHRARDLHLRSGAVDAARDGRLRVLRHGAARAGTRSRSAATTCARRVRPPRRSWRSRSPNAIAYVEAAVARGLDIDAVAGRLSFFFGAWSELFEEVAKFRAARRMWARIMRDRFGATDPRSMMCRFHVQTAGSSLTARSVDNNVVRTTIQALAAVLGGTQSLHTNARDEALALPTEESARLALRTQQIIAYEAGVTETPDPLGRVVVRRVADRRGRGRGPGLPRRHRGRRAARSPRSSAGIQQRAIQDAAYLVQREVEAGERIVVGVNRYVDDEQVAPPLQRIDPRMEHEQVARLAAAASGARRGGLVGRP